MCVKPPHYVHTWAEASRADIVGRYQAITRVVPPSMMLYNSPNRVEVLKDTNPDANFLMQRVLQFGGRMPVLVRGAFFYTGMLLGAGGTIAMINDLFGHDADRMFDFEKMGVEERREFLIRELEVGHAITYLGSIPAAYKSASNMMGLPAGYLRDPLRPLTPEQETELRRVLAKWKALDDEGQRHEAR